MRILIQAFVFYALFVNVASAQADASACQALLGENVAPVDTPTVYPHKVGRLYILIRDGANLHAPDVPDFQFHLMARSAQITWERSFGKGYAGSVWIDLQNTRDKDHRSAFVRSQGNVVLYVPTMREQGLLTADFADDLILLVAYETQHLIQKFRGEQPPPTGSTPPDDVLEKEAWYTALDVLLELSPKADIPRMDHPQARSYVAQKRHLPVDIFRLTGR